MRAGRDGVDAVPVERLPHLVEVVPGELLRVVELVVVHQAAEALDGRPDFVRRRGSGQLRLVPAGVEPRRHRSERPDPETRLHAATLSAYARRVQFHLDQRSGLPMYLQIVQQVKEALRLGLLEVGDQLPTVREVVAATAINPNTVAKAYRELERDGLVSATPGRGTFIRSTLAARSL